MREMFFKLLSYVLVVGGAYAAIQFSWYGREVAQPAPFPHARHVALNVSCAACHTGSSEGMRARLPSIQSCKLCHRVDRTFPSTPRQLAAFTASGQNIPWNQAQKLPAHVYFSHRRHIVAAKLNCVECHGNVGGAMQPISRAYLSSGEAGMAQCIDCHRKRGASEDCLACHR